MKRFGRDRDAWAGRGAPDPVDEARIKDLYTGDQEPDDLDVDASPRLRDAADWVRETRTYVQGLAPADDLAARIRRSLPVGAPGTGSKTPFHRRASTWIGIAAAALVVVILAWQLADADRANRPQDTRPDAPVPTASLGLVHVTSLDGTRTRTVAAFDNGAIETGASEEARIRFSPWRTSPYPSEDELTIVALDPDSKLHAKLYRPDDEPAFGMRQAAFFDRALGAPPVETAILELTVLRGTAEIVHHGQQSELRFPDMVLVAPLRAIVRTGEQDDQNASNRETFAERRAPDPSEHVEPNSASVFGRVVETGTGAPVPRFDIVVWPIDQLGFPQHRWDGTPPAPITFESGAGEFQIVELEPGRYRFFVRTPTHVLAASEELTLLDGEQRQLDVGLRAGHTVTGRVLDARTKEPIPNARVTFLAHAAEDAPWQFRDVHGTVGTAADGSYRCTNRPVGRQSVRIAAEGYGSARFGPIYVRRDGLPTRDIDVFLEPEARITGRVTTWPGVDPKSLSVVVNAIGPFWPERSPLDAHLEYSVRGLAGGSYFVHLVRDTRTALMTKRVELSNGETLNVDLVPSGVRVQGTVKQEGGAPVGVLEVSFYQTSETWRRRAPTFRTYSTLDGRFEAWLPPGESFQVRVRRDADDERWSVFGPKMSVPTSGEAEALTIDLQGQEVSGQITGASLESIWKSGQLVLRDETLGERRWTTELRDERGRFAFPHVPPGTYRLSGTLHDHIVEEQILRIGLGGRCGIDLGVIPQARVILRLIDEEGNALSRMDIRAVYTLDADDHRRRHWIDSNERGIIVFGLAPGSTRLVVETIGHGRIELTRTLAPGQLNEIPHRLVRAK